MKSLLLLTLLLFASSSFAADWSWNKEDISLEVISAGITVVDWGQTLGIEHTRRVETNPILGDRPSRGRINRYFSAVMALHPLISAALPREAEPFGWKISPRLAWQYVYFGVEAAAISSNFRGGLRMSF
jgi:hypothetical protein